MIDTKDTFYIMLRDRLAILNPSRTVVLRGVTRPGVLVEENELATQEVILDAFRLRWTTLHVDTRGPLPLATMVCEIRYATAGTSTNGGMDRGRLLTEMDSELRLALGTADRTFPKTNYANSSFGDNPVPMATNIFWSDVTYLNEGALTEEMERAAMVHVFCYEEAGE